MIPWQLNPRLTFREFIAAIRDEYEPTKPDWFEVTFEEPPDWIKNDDCPNNRIAIAVTVLNEPLPPHHVEPLFTFKKKRLEVVTFGWYFISAEVDWRFYDAYLEMEKIAAIAEQYRMQFLQFEDKQAAYATWKRHRDFYLAQHPEERKEFEEHGLV